MSRTASKAEARRAARELELLGLLEKLRRARTPTWPSDFARRAGFRSVKALNTYPDLRAALHTYALRTAPEKMRGVDVQAVQGAVAASVRTERRARSQALAADVQQLNSALEAATIGRDSLRAELNVIRRQLAQARAMVDSLADFLAHRDAPLAADVERRLHRLAAEATGHAPRVPQRAGAPNLQVIEGDA